MTTVPTPAAARPPDEPWVAGLLRPPPPPPDDASVAGLRAFLLRGLRRALAGRAGADDAFLEDAAQESTVRVLGRLHTFRGDSRLTTWVTTVAVRVAMAELRRARWRDVSLDQLLRPAGDDGTGGDGTGGDARRAGVEPAADSADQPEQVAHRRMVLDTVRRVIDADLTDRQRTALLAELEGMSQPALADKLGTTRNALYKLVHDARRNLKAGLAAAGLSADDVRDAFDR